MDEQEKQRCALLMQFKGNIPCPSSQLTPAGCAKVAAAKARCISSSSGSGPAHAAVGRIAEHRALLQQRFEEVEQEVRIVVPHMACQMRILTTAWPCQGCGTQELWQLISPQILRHDAVLIQLAAGARHLDRQSAHSAVDHLTMSDHAVTAGHMLCNHVID